MGLNMEIGEIRVDNENKNVFVVCVGYEELDGICRGTMDVVQHINIENGVVKRVYESSTWSHFYRKPTEDEIEFFKKSFENSDWVFENGKVERKRIETVAQLKNELVADGGLDQRLLEAVNRLL